MKVAGALFIALALAVVGLWVSHGADLATREQVPVTVKKVDDFGDEVETTEWRAPTDFPLTGFHLGIDRAGPIAGALLLVGAGLLVVGFRMGRKKA